MPKTTKSKTVGAIGDDVRTLTDAQLIAYADQFTGELDDAHAAVMAAEAAFKAAADERDRLWQVVREAESAEGRINNRLDAIAGEQLRRTVGFSEGDIVEDELGVRYRVHSLYFADTRRPRRGGGYQDVPAGSVFGIRLTKSGAEAYATPRRIVSSAPLRKVEVE